MPVQRAFTNLDLNWNWFTPANWAATDFSVAVPAITEDAVIEISAVNSQPVTILNGDAAVNSLLLSQGVQLLVGQSGTLTTNTSIGLIALVTDAPGTELIIQNGGIVTVAGGGGNVNLTSVTSGLLIGGAAGGGNAVAAGTLVAASVIENGATNFVKFNVTNPNYVFSTAIVGSGTVIQQGTNSTVVLTGANSYSGGTTINSGTLQIGNGGTNGTLGSGAVANHSKLAFDVSGSLTIGAVIGGEGQVSFDGGGVYSLTGQNTYTGAVTIAANTAVAVTGTGSLGTGAIANTGLLEFADSSPLTVFNAITGAGAVSILSGNVKFSVATTYSGVTDIGVANAPATLQAGATNAFSANSDFVLGAGGVLDVFGRSEAIGGLSDAGNSGAAAVVDNTGGNVTLTISEKKNGEIYHGTIENTVGALSLVVTQTSGNTFVLAGNNTYSGTTEVAGGVLQIGDGGATGTLGSGAVIVDAAGKLLIDLSNQYDFSNTFSGAGALEFEAGGVGLILANSAGFSGQVTIDAGYTLDIGGSTTAGTLGTAAIIDNGTLDIDRTDGVTIANTISGTGQVQIFDATTVLTGSNSYQGGTRLSFNGVLKAGAANVLSASSVVTVDSGSTLDLGGFSETIGGLAGNGVLGGLSALTIAGGGGAAFTGTYSGILALTKTGAGTQILANSNTGGIKALINGGTLQMGNGGALALSSASFTNNANLVLNASGPTTLATGFSVSGSGSVTYSGGAYTITSSHFTYTGVSTIGVGAQVNVGTGAGNVATFGTGAIVDNGIFQLNRTGVQTIASAISGTGLFRQSAGTVTLTGTNSYSGGTEVAAGATLIAGATNAFGSGAVTVATSGTLDFGGFDETVSGLVNNGILTSSSPTTISWIHGIVTNNGLVSVNGGGVEFNGNVTGSGSVSIAAGLLVFDSAFNQNVVFSGQARVVFFQAYTGVISGASNGDQISFFNVLYNAQEKVVWQSTAAGIQTWALENASNVVLATVKLKGHYGAGELQVGDDTQSNTAFIGVNHNPAPISSDFNKDGLSDILLRNVNGTVALWNSGPAYVYASVGSLDSTWQIAGISDFNNDGAADFLLRNTNGTVAQWASNGSGGYVYTSVGSLDSTWLISGVGDFNGDRKADMLLRNTNGTVALWDSNAGGYVYTSVGSLDSSWQIAGVSDFNGDGLADILLRNANGTVALWNSNSAGGYAYASVGPLDSSWQIAEVSDFNSDGMADVLLRNTNGTVALWDSNGVGGYGYATVGSLDSSWQIAGVSDLNGDGAADILLRNTNGVIAAWESNAAGGYTYTSVGSLDSTWVVQRS